MLTIHDQSYRLCDGMTRRDWLRLSGLGMLGLSASAAAQDTNDALLRKLERRAEAIRPPADEVRWQRIPWVLDLQQAVKQAVRAVLPPAYLIEKPGARSEENQRMLRAFRWNLRVLGYISLVVGAFLIYNTISISVVRRRADVLAQAQRRRPDAHSPEL